MHSRPHKGPIKLVAMADVFEDRLAASYDQLLKEHGKKVDVPEDRKFIGFDAYQKAMDCLKPGDVVIFATPPAFRWVHFTYAIQKGLHTFMEKPISVDGPTTRKMIALAEEAKKKSLKVGVGPDVPPLRGSRRTVRPHQGRPDRRPALAAGLSPDGPGRLALYAAQARRHQRAALPDPEVPRIPLGQRWLLQRLLDPQYR